MIQIDKVQRIEGVTVFGDHERFDTFYLVPERATIRRTETGAPSFSFFKYRLPIDRPDGKRGGGFCLFDTAFTVSKETEDKVKAELQGQVRAEARRRGVDQVPDVKIGTITYTKGSCNLIIAGSDGTFVEKIQNSGKPSLFGENTATFGVELTPEGATFFEQAMQGDGPSVAVEYDLWFIAGLPKVRINCGFRATEFYSFYQTIDTDWNLWAEDSYKETVREMMISSESLWFNADWGMVTDEKIRGPIRDWAMRTLEDSVERRMIEAIAPVPDDERKKPDGIEDVTRDITSTKISTFTLTYTERQAVEWNLAPNGPLQNITSMVDNDGNKILWENHARVIDLDDPFFRQLRVNVSANADFAALPIHSVEVLLRYKGRPMPNFEAGEPEGEIVLRDASKIGKFGVYVDDDDYKYEYQYEINYKGQSRTFKSELLTTDEGNLTIGVADSGILNVKVSAGDLNWNDVERALVTFKYEDRGVAPIERQFQLSSSSTSHDIQEIIFEPMRKNYEYSVKYFMKNGKEVQGETMEGRSDHLFINDVFSANRTVNVRSAADFSGRVGSIFLDLFYVDEDNDYRQEKSVALTVQKTFDDWIVPVISETAGVVSYQANIAYKDGTSETIPRTILAGNTLIVPPPVEDFLKVELITDLLDWTTTRLVRVSLSYQDADNNVSENKDFIFSSSRSASETWTVEQKDKAVDSYSYTITYYMTDRTQKVVGPETSSEASIVLDPFL